MIEDFRTSTGCVAELHPAQQITLPRLPVAGIIAPKVLFSFRFGG